MERSSRATAWLGRQVFDAVHGRHLVYNQCWEDPAVDRQALDLGWGARVIFRSGGPDEGFLPLSVLRRLGFERERAKRLHRQDRVGTYASFHIARLAPAG